MGDYGIRISKEGNDVKTCADKDCVITSKYPTLKGTLSGLGSISGLASGGSTVITINHSLGYIPFVKALLNPTNSIDFGNVYYQLPIWIDDVEDHLYSRVYATATQIKIYVEQWNAHGNTRNYNYKYFIFIDKAKL